MTFLNQLQQHLKSIEYSENNTHEIKSFSDISKEFYEVENGNNILSHLGQYGLLNLTGEEAADFLHKQLTNDVLHLTEGAARHAAWCTAKGRMLASMVVYRLADTINVLLSRDLAEQTTKRLQMYILRAKAKATDVSQSVEIFGVAGKSAEMMLRDAGFPIPPAPPVSPSSNELTTAVTQADITVIRLNDRVGRFMLVIPAQDALGVWEKLAEKATPVGVPAWQYLDIQAGLPVVTQATCEAFVPQMVDFDLLGGVNFKKGCYPGQEIVARAHYLGKVKRHLYRVRSASPIAAGEELHTNTAPDQAIGMIVSAVQTNSGDWVGLASIVETSIDDLIVPLVCTRIFDEAPQ